MDLAWLLRTAEAAPETLQPEGTHTWRRSARRVRRDHEAVLAAVLSPWSKGQVEGQVHRLTLIKRNRYGRAGFARLRRRVLRVA